MSSKLWAHATENQSLNSKRKAPGKTLSLSFITTKLKSGSKNYA